VYVTGDRTRLVQVVSNLLNNAAKYTPPNGSLTVSMALGEEVEIRVADNGIGIDSGLLPHVFELFTQGERTPDRAQGGLGLGLALVKSLVELHGGQVRAESEGPGRGSAFVFTLPLLKVAPARDASEPEGGDLPRASRRLRVMVVDDNKDAAETLGLLLESLGHEVRVMHDPAAAIAACQVASIDVFILDIGLPGMSGFALAQALRAGTNGTAATFIALTGYGGSDDRQRAEEAGFDHYLVKPASADVLVELLNALEVRR
jgi:CheY-like chemotaxis protein